MAFVRRKGKTTLEPLTQNTVKTLLTKRPSNEEMEESADPEEFDQLDDSTEEEDFSDFEEEEAEPEPLPKPKPKKPKKDNRGTVPDDELDIFELCEEMYVTQGTPIKYFIQKNGSYIGEMDHPCSWKKIQDTYGGGVYTVSAKNVFTKMYVKKKTMSITETTAPIKQKNNEYDEENQFMAREPQVIERIVEREAPAQPVNYFEMFNVLNKMQETSQSAIKDAQKESQSSQNTLMAALLQMASTRQAPESKSDDKVMALMIQMQQNSNQMFEKMMEISQKNISEVQKSNEKMFDKLSERIEKANEGKSGNGLAYTPEQIMQLMAQGQERGFQMWQNMEKMADMKVAQRLDVLEATRDTAVEESRPKSMTEKLIDTMLPVAASLIQAQAASMAAKEQVTAPIAQVQPRQAQPRPALPERAVQPAQVQRPRPQPQAQPRPQAAAQAQPAPQKPQEQPQRNVTPATIKKDSHNFPSATAPKPEAQAQETITKPDDSEKFVTYMNFCAPILTEGYTGQKPIPACAITLIESLKTQNIGLVDFIRTCTLERVLATLKQYGADESAVTFVKGIYAYIEAAAANGGL